MQPSAWMALGGLVVGLVGFGRFRSIGRHIGSGTERGTGHSARSAERGARVRIIIPARNEASNLPGLLSDLGGELPAQLMVTVVDDHSTDDTRRVVERFEFVDLLSAPSLPHGWTGKSWACHVAAESAASGDVLVFLDADVRLAPGAVDDLLAERARRGGVVSVQPRHLVRRPIERLSALFNVVSVIGIGAGWRHPAGLFGPVVCITARDYRMIGGHAAVRGEVIEDVALGRRAVAAGLPVTVLGGGDRFTFRMYPDGFFQLVEGWTKNFASGARSAGGRATIGAAGLITALCSVSWQLAGLAVGAASWSAPVVWGLATAAVLTLLVMFHRIGNFGLGTALAFPVLVTFFVAVFGRSVYRTVVRRNVVWRGRTIPIGGAGE